MRRVRQISQQSQQENLYVAQTNQLAVTKVDICLDIHETGNNLLQSSPIMNNTHMLSQAEALLSTRSRSCTFVSSILSCSLLFLKQQLRLTPVPS